MPDDITRDPTKFVLIDVGGAFAFKDGDRLCKGTEVHWTWNYGSLDMHRDPQVGTALPSLDPQADIPVHPHVTPSQNARPTDDMWALFYSLTVLSQCALPWMRPERITADEVYNRKRQFSAFPERFIGAEHHELLDFHKQLTLLQRGELTDCQYETFEQLLNSMFKRSEGEQTGAPPVRASNAGRRKPVASISKPTSFPKAAVELPTSTAVATGPCKSACVETSNAGRHQKPPGTMNGNGEQAAILPASNAGRRKPVATISIPKSAVDVPSSTAVAIGPPVRASNAGRRKPVATISTLTIPNSAVEPTSSTAVAIGPPVRASNAGRRKPVATISTLTIPKFAVEPTSSTAVAHGPYKNTVCHRKAAGMPNQNCKQAGIHHKPATVPDLGQIKLILEQIVDRVSGTSTPTYADSEASKAATGNFDSSDQEEPMDDIDRMKKLLEEIMDRVRVGQAMSASSGDKCLASEQANSNSSFDSGNTAISMADAEQLNDKAPQQAVSTAESRPNGSPPGAKKNGLRWLQSLGRKWESPKARGDDVPSETAEAASVDNTANVTESNQSKNWFKNFCIKATAWCRKG
ncbi:hypothetical protein HDU96_008585 [Phlyctochytrium bullatum]|nr:hypothetical protein HDU96_008585 [Phlyctochytrium bullatum]